ncbi:T9SS type B sorting domain-containing protein [Flavobacterium aestivum]|uniref:T9SS type B sorting domain-containing protein n=1 Tax=Flavobacterium aestivum TaxID=3003257 RepID=UPI0024832223|nr:T9SS type B sorting domain-containing protein [Flavobacterium aestivum]
MKKIYILFIFLSCSVFAQVDPRTISPVPVGCKPAVVPPPLPMSPSSKKPGKTKIVGAAGIAATGYVGSVESIHSAFVNWPVGGFDSFSIGTDPTPNGTNAQNIKWGQGLNSTDKSTGGYSYEELRLSALALGTTFAQGQNFYFHLFNGGTDTVVGPLNFTWQDLGVAGNALTVNVETNYGINGKSGFTAGESANMMDFYSKVIPIVEQVYGASSHAYTVNVINDGNSAGTNTFYNGPNRITTQFTADASGKMTQPRLMVHELIHAWRDNVCLSSSNVWHYDNTLSGFEEGMADCVAEIVMDKFAAAYPNYFPAGISYLNKHWSHEDGYAFDWDYDFQNHPQLTTTDFWSSDQGIGAQLERYGTGSAAFYKMYVEDNNFFKNFNAEYYRRMNADHTLTTSRALMVDICKTVLSKVEEKPTEKWIDKQRILDCKVVPGKKVHMLSYEGTGGWQYMTHDNRIHLIETQNLPGGNEWSWDKYSGGTLIERWFHQLNNQAGKIDIVNYTTGTIFNTQNFRNNDSGYGGPNQGPCTPPNTNGNSPASPCFPRGIDGHGLYTTSADPAITGGVVNSADYYLGFGLAADRFIWKIQDTGLYIYNIEFQTGGETVKGKYYRLHGNGFLSKDGIYAGVRNNNDTPVLGKMFVEQKNFVTPLAGEEPAIPINNGTLIDSRAWASVPETQSQFQGGRTDTRYTKPGKVHVIYVDQDCTKPQKIGFRNVGYGAGVSGVQMFLFNVDDFDDIKYKETMPDKLCEGDKAEFSVTYDADADLLPVMQKYLDTDSRITYKWINPAGTVVSTSKTYTIAAVTSADSGEYTLEITSYGCSLPPITKRLEVTELRATLSSSSPICSGDNAVFKISGKAGNTVTYTGAASGTAIVGVGGTVDVTVNGVTADATLNLTNVSDGTCNHALTETNTIRVNPLLKPVISCGTPTQNSVTFNWGAVSGATNYTVSYQVNSNPIQNIGAIGNLLTYSVASLNASDNVTISITPTGATGICFAIETKTCQASPIPPCTIPVANITSINPSISCASPTVTLDGTGSTTGVGITYHWTTTGGIITSGATTLNPVVSAAGTYTLVVTNAEGSGCNSTPATVTVSGNSTFPDVPQLLSSSDSPICAGEDITFTITGTPGDNVTYDGAASGTITIQPNGKAIVSIIGAISDTTLRLTKVSNGTCDLSMSRNTKTVYVRAKPNAGTDSRLTICLGTTPTNAQLFAQLKDNPDAGGTWTNVGNEYTYKVYAKAPCTLFATAKVIVTTQALPNAGVNGVLTICSGTRPTDKQLFDQLGGHPDIGGKWTNVGNIYTYKVKGESPCSSYATATVTVTTQAKANAGITGVLTICSGATPTEAQLFAQLGGKPDTGGVWNRSNVNANEYIYTVSPTGVCTEPVTAKITVTEINAIAKAGDDKEITCKSSVVTLNGVESSSTGYTYLWTGGTIVSGATTLTPTVNAAGTYTLTVTNTALGCKQSDSVLVTNNTVLPIADAGNTGVITCLSPVVKLDGTGSTNGADMVYTWTGGKIVMGTNTLTPTVTTIGTYTLKVENSATGCSSTDTVEVIQDIETPDFSITDLGSNQFEIVPSGGMGPYEYSLNNANEYTSNPIIKIYSSGNYTIYVKDSKGCYTSQSKYLDYLGIEFPKFFSPEGDGTNDHWYPTRIEDYPNLEVLIYDRYQRLIAKFKGNNELGWDGTYQGKPLPSGDYWYVIKTNNDNDKRELVGGMTLFR